MSETSNDPYGWRTSFHLPDDVEGVSTAALSVAEAWKDACPAEPSVTAQRYRKVSVLGEGGMGRVWLGWDTGLERSVAIKEPLAGPQEAARLNREARLCARLDHAGVVAIYDVFNEDDRPHFVMALVRGQTLAMRMEKVRPEERRTLVRHVMEVCEAVGHAHRKGIVHRDLTPRNIVIDEDGVARVIDWGLAVTAGEERPGRAGTRGFVAPEQQRGELATPRADVWSLGSLLHTALSGRPLGEAELAANIDPELRAIVDCATAADPDRRYADAIQMGNDLRRWFEGRPVEAFQFTPWTLLRRVIRIYRGRIALAFVIVTALASSLVYGLWTTARESERARTAEDVATRRAAEMLRRDAELALRGGDLWRARASALESLETYPTPQARGVWMQVSMTRQPERLERRLLPSCAQWLLNLDNTYMACMVSDQYLQIWRGDQLVWERRGWVTDVRIDQDEAHVLDNHRSLMIYDLESGAILREDPREGGFTSRMDGIDRMDMSHTRWFDGAPLPEDCPEGIAQAHRWDGVPWIVCLSGEIFRGNGSGEMVKVWSPTTTDAPLLLARAAGRVWTGSQAGVIEPVDGQSRRLDLGQALQAIQAIPGTNLILAVGRAGAVRVLDAIRGEWIASLPDDVISAHVTHGGVWLLRSDGHLERWGIKPQPLWHHRTEHGYASLAWSLDGALLAATDGAGYFRLLEPMAGKIHPPVQVATRVARDVAVSPVDGDFRVVTMDHRGLYRMVLDQGRVHARHEGIHSEAEAVPGIGYLASGAPYSLSYVRGFVYYPDGEPRPVLDGHPPITNLSLHHERHDALLIGKNGDTWLWQEGSEPRAMPWPKARLGAIADDHRVALISADGELLVYDADGRLESSWTLPPSPVISVTWRRTRPMIITGHLDGTIRVYAETGALLAELHHHTGRISKLETTPDGRLLGASSWDASVSISSLEALDETLSSVVGRTP
jgi:hypothetical protein